MKTFINQDVKGLLTVSPIGIMSQRQFEGYCAVCVHFKPPLVVFTSVVPRRPCLHLHASTSGHVQREVLINSRLGGAALSGMILLPAHRPRLAYECNFLIGLDYLITTCSFCVFMHALWQQAHTRIAPPSIPSLCEHSMRLHACALAHAPYRIISRGCSPQCRPVSHRAGAEASHHILAATSS